MAPYCLLFGFTGIFGFILCEFKKSRKSDLIFLIVLTGILIVMASVRAHTVGVDTEVYMDYFSNMVGRSPSFLVSKENIYWREPAYGLLNFIFAQITDSPAVFMGIVSGLIIGLRSILIYRYSSKIWLSVFVYITFGFFGYAMCTLRQELGISVALFALPFLQKRKIIPYMLIVILAACFHISLWVMIPVYFFVHIPFNKITLQILGAGTVLLLIFSEQILTVITKVVYQNYQPGSYYTLGRDYSTAVFPVVFFILSLLLMKKLLKNNPENIVLMHFSCYAAVLFILTIRHFVFQRIALIFLPVLILLIPELLECSAPDPEKVEELLRLQGLDKARQKQQKDKMASLMAEHKNAVTLYYTVMGLLMAGCITYYLFLLSTNRLGLVPYIPFWKL